MSQRTIDRYRLQDISCHSDYCTYKMTHRGKLDFHSARDPSEAFVCGNPSCHVVFIVFHGKNIQNASIQVKPNGICEIENTVLEL